MKLVIIIFLILILSCNGASAWYDGFDYRIPITIDNTGNPALEHYQFNVSIPSGIDESSIRIVNDTDYTIVPHWCENETDGLCYELWFNVSVGSEVNTDYYIYYGNDSLFSTSNYDNTFTKKYNDSGLVLELHIDEGTGNSVTVDSSGEGNDGTLTNMNVTGNATSGWQGVDGGQWDNRSDVIFADGDQIRFDGVNDYINCGNDPSIQLTNPITFSTAVKCVDDTTGFIISKYQVGNNRYELIKTSTFFSCSFGDGATSRSAKYTMSPIVGKWYNVVGTIDAAGVIKVYVDGIEGGLSETLPNPVAGITGNLVIGKRVATYFNGYIDEVRIYNRTLSEDEIYRQYIRSKYAANTPLISIGYIEKIPHPFLSGAYLFYGEMSTGLTGFKDGMGRYLIWGVVFFAVSLTFALIGKIKSTLIGGK